MDPISIVGISIALVGASLNVSEGLVKLISHIKNTPNELLQASNDVTDFRLLLLNIEDSIRDEERLWRMLRSQSHPRLCLLARAATLLRHQKRKHSSAEQRHA